MTLDIVGECNFLIGKKKFSFLGGRVPELMHAGFVVPTDAGQGWVPAQGNREAQSAGGLQGRYRLRSSLRYNGLE